MILLLVAKSESIHTARWISQLEDQGWNIHLFPSGDYGEVHAAMRHVTVHHSYFAQLADWDYSIKTTGVSCGNRYVAAILRRIVRLLKPDYRAQQLAQLIRELKPDVVHALELQGAGYLVETVKRTYKDIFPPLVVTNWGSDIYLFGRDPKHKTRIESVLLAADYYSCECHRDVALAKSLGFAGIALPVFPNSGGFDLEKVQKWRKGPLTSSRRLIMVKGYQGWSGRALTALKALEGCRDLLSGYTIVVYSPDQAVIDAAEELTRRTGIATRIIPRGTAHDEILRLQGQARISIGLGISDAISTAVLEAMVMGAFPIQSNTSCANEWINNAQTGMIVAPENVDELAHALRKALEDDALVDSAAVHNWHVAQKRLDSSILKPQVISFYKQVYQGK